MYNLFFLVPAVAAASAVYFAIAPVAAKISEILAALPV